jgi:hypothetical protein
LRQPRPEAIERLLHILHVHGRAAPDQCAQRGWIALGVALHQPLDHGRGREHRGAGPGAEQAEDFLGLERTGLRDHVHAHTRDVRQHIDAGAVAQRRGVQRRIAGRDGIDVTRIGVARPGEHAVRERRALGLARGARGVEQPSEIVAGARLHLDRIASKQLRVFGAVNGNQPLQRGRRMRRNLCVEPF